MAKMDGCDKTDDNNQDKQTEDDKETNSKQVSSKFGSLNPEKSSHNMNDLKTLDFNSADEIRQTMKAVLAGNPLQYIPDEANNCAALKGEPDTKSQGTPQTPPNQMIHKTVQIETKDNIFQCINSRQNDIRDYRRKRPGRPPKAGTSKKLKRASVSDLYVGKLSNVVSFKRRRYGSGSESDDWIPW